MGSFQFLFSALAIQPCSPSGQAGWGPKYVCNIGGQGSGRITADLRFSHARLYAVLPRAIGNVELQAASDVKPGLPFNWTATVPGIRARLPLRAELRDGNGTLLDKRSTTTGPGTFTAPRNVVGPLTLTVVELVSGTRASAVVVPAAGGNHALVGCRVGPASGHHVLMVNGAGPP